MYISVCKTARLLTEQGRNSKGPTACSLLSERMSDKNYIVNVVNDEICT